MVKNVQCKAMIVILSAPSGGGKTSISKIILKIVAIWISKNIAKRKSLAALIAEENWLKIPELIKQKEIASDLSFKEKENDNNIRTELYQALLGYINFDMSEFLEKIDISEDSKIIL